MDEAAARQTLLAQAIETTDRAGRLLSQAERDAVDRQVRHDALQRIKGRGPLPPAEFVHFRAQRVLAAVGVHHPGVVALQEPAGWRPWLEGGLPIAAFMTGMLADVVGNPHRLDLLSLPLLGIVAWNVVMYILLAASPPTRHGSTPPWVARVGRWGDGARSWRMNADDPRSWVAARFHLLWLGATQALHVQRVKRVLHVSAAAWATGVILSLLVRGLVVEYRVGWESTFLGPTQVHAILSVLRLPALLMLPFEPFTVMDVAALRFSNGGGAVGGAPWVWMYVSLLITVVVLPRLLLATFAAWRESRLANSFALDLGDAYHSRIVSLLTATRVRLGLLTHRAADREAMLRVLVVEGQLAPLAVSSDIGDVLLVEDFPPAPRPTPAVQPWWRRAVNHLSGAAAEVAAPEDEIDVLIHVVGATEDGGVEAEQPLLTVRMPGVAEPPAGEHQLDFDSFAACWVLERRLFDAIGRLLPASKSNGFLRIVLSVQARRMQRLRDSMSAIARHLLDAARQAEEVPASALSVKNLLAAQRQVQTDARQVAMDAIIQRLRQSSDELFSRLRKLHGVNEAEGQALEHRLEERFLVQQAVDAPQAGMAGAATGAAMGVSVDLLAGGLTLGAAAALGALVGGGAAFIAAAWKNRMAPGGGTLVQLSEVMLDALLRSALMRYLAIAHCGVLPQPQPTGSSEQAWEQAVNEEVRLAETLTGFWNAARTQPETDRLVDPFARELEKATMQIFERLYPDR